MEAGDERRIVKDCSIGSGTNIAEFAVLDDCRVGRNCQIWRFTNLYGADIGDECMVGSFVEIQQDVEISYRCRVQSHAFICSQVTLESDVFVSHGAKFTNDLYPPSGEEAKWEETIIRRNAVIGTNATLLPVEIGENALVGAGAVVVEDVPPNAIVAGNPAEIIGYRDE